MLWIIVRTVLQKHDLSPKKDKNRIFVTALCVHLQGVFDHRMKTWQKWQDSQLLLQRKREAEAKLQFTNKPDKLQQAKDEIKEVRHTQTNNQNTESLFHYINAIKCNRQDHRLYRRYQDIKLGR